MIEPGSVTVLMIRVDASRWQEAPPTFSDGPLPLPFQAERTTREVRSRFFHRPVAAALYGDVGGGRRWHSEPSGGQRFRSYAVEGVELLRSLDTFSHDVLLLHLRSDHQSPDTLASLRFVGGSTWTADVELIHELTGGRVTLPPEARGRSKRAFLVTYARLSKNGPRLYGHNDDIPALLFSVAAAVRGESFEPSPHMPALPETHLSASWRCLVLRDGAAFLARAEADEFVDSGSAEVLARSVYTDALLLGCMQDDVLTSIADGVAQSIGEHPTRQSLEALVDRFEAFNVILWWGRVTSHGHPNHLLHALQAQRHVERLYTEVNDSLERRAATVRREQSDRTNWLLALVAIVGLPLTMVVGITQIALMGSPSTAVWAGVVSFVTAASLVLVYWVVLRPVRRK